MGLHIAPSLQHALRYTSITCRRLRIPQPYHHVLGSAPSWHTPVPRRNPWLLRWCSRWSYHRRCLYPRRLPFCPLLGMLPLGRPQPSPSNPAIRPRPASFALRVLWVGSSNHSCSCIRKYILPLPAPYLVVTASMIRVHMGRNVKKSTIVLLFFP